MTQVNSNESSVKEITNAMIELEHKGHQITLEMMMLNYLFNEDDGKLSKQEMKIIKKHYSLYKNKLTTDARDEMHEILNKNITISDVTSFIREHYISRKTLEDSMKVLDEISETDEYKELIKGIKLYLYSMTK